jgi:hypothetical protein
MMQESLNPNIQSAASPQSNWQALKDAIRGTEADYTKIGLKRAIVL